MDVTNYKLIATLAFLRTLYNNDRRNIYHVIAEMVRSTIVKNGLNRTSITELSSLLKKEYGVSIINPVLSYSIKKLVGLKMDQEMGLSVLPEFSSNVSDEIERISIQSRNNNDMMLSELCDFIEQKKGEKLTEQQRECVKADMCYYVSHDSIVDSPYKGYIGTFYIEKEKAGAPAYKTFNTIHEGKILYDGLSGSGDLDSVELFDKPLKVYLETEILFHAVGLNGELYEHLFKQFYEQVESINRAAIQKQGHKVISLHFFPETENEIGVYFTQAEQILQKKLSSAQPGNAMDIILSSCKSPADVKIKEHNFWKKLSELGILAESTKYDIVQNSQYNLVSAEEAARAKKKYAGELSFNDEQRAYDALQMLSKINYNRRNSNARNFKTADSVLVTGRAMTLDYSLRLTPKGDVPFAVSMSYLTNRFWFSYHRGLFDSEHSITSDQLLGFAQIAVCQQINDTLREEFISLSNDVKEGRLSKEEAASRVAALRKDLVVSSDDVPEMVEDQSCYDFFDRGSLARIIEEKELQSQERDSQLEDTKATLAKKNEIIRRLLSFQNEREVEEYEKAQKEYRKEELGWIQRKKNKKICACWIIVIIYFLLFGAALFSSVVPAWREIPWPKYILFGICALAIIGDYLLRLINAGFIIHAFCYLFNYKNTRGLYEKEMEAQYEANHSVPVLTLSTEETFMVE